MKIFLYTLLTLILLAIGCWVWKNSNGQHTGLGQILRRGDEITLTLNAEDIKPGEGLESVSFLIWQQRLDCIAVFLESPSGIRCELTRSNGKGGSWYWNTTVSDNSETLIYKAEHPYKGTYRPHQFMGWLNQGKINGKWKLIVRNTHPFSSTGFIAWWTIKFGDHPCKLKSIDSSTLPVLVINTNKNKQVAEDKKVKASIYILGDSAVNYVRDTSGAEQIPVKIKVRGFSSTVLPKKSYSFDLTEASDTALFHKLHLPSGSEWILTSNFMEKSLIRNSMTYELYRQAGYVKCEDRHVDIILNGAYIGIYVLQEKMKPTALKLQDTYFAPDGFMVKMDSPIDKKPGFSSMHLGWQSTHYPFFQYIYPTAKEIQPQRKKYIEDRILTMELSFFNLKPGDSVNQAVNLRSFADYFIFEELSKNNDGFNLSAFFYTDAKGRIAIGPIWDFDRAWGNSTSNQTRDSSGWRILYHDHDDYHPIPDWWKNLLTNKQFQQATKERWIELSASVFNNNNINSLIDSLAAPLRLPQERNFTTWPIWGVSRSNFYTNSSIKNYDDEINDLKQWIVKRRTWMDREIRNGHYAVYKPAI